MKTRLGVLILLMMGMTHCTSVAHIQTDDATNVALSPTKAEEVAVFALDDVGQNYTVIGEVIAAADAGKDADKAVEALKEEAAQLGANAVVNVRLEIEYGNWSSGIKAYGIAIRFE